MGIKKKQNPSSKWIEKAERQVVHIRTHLNELQRFIDYARRADEDSRTKDEINRGDLPPEHPARRGYLWNGKTWYWPAYKIKRGK